MLQIFNISAKGLIQNYAMKGEQLFFKWGPRYIYILLLPFHRQLPDEFEKSPEPRIVSTSFSALVCCTGNWYLRIIRVLGRGCSAFIPSGLTYPLGSRKIYLQSHLNLWLFFLPQFLVDSQPFRVVICSDSPIVAFIHHTVYIRTLQDNVKILF